MPLILNCYHFTSKIYLQLQPYKNKLKSKKLGKDLKNYDYAYYPKKENNGYPRFICVISLFYLMLLKQDKMGVPVSKFKKNKSQKSIEVTLILPC